MNRAHLSASTPELCALRTRAAQRTLAGAMFVVLLGACDEPRGEAGADTVRGASSSTAGAAGGAAASLTDANILALLDGANVTDSAAGAVAVSKASSSELRSFAAQMIRDHHSMRLEGERVARRLRLTPEVPAGSDEGSGLTAILAVLNSTARGSDFDKAYIDHEVAFHLDFLETAIGAMEEATETEVKAFVQKLAPMLEEHLDLAQALQARLR
ncbi:MAG TPA: DUF4142 domain-containing protein [Gemmatimonadaceae bacterium]|nr:DUF4142 domain-containing protein [Gemmatimonadaceae bacterium]